MGLGMQVLEEQCHKYPVGRSRRSGTGFCEWSGVSELYHRSGGWS